RLVLRGALKLNTQPPRLLSLAIGPGELQRNVGNAPFLPHVLRFAVHILLRIAQTIALEVTGGGGPGGGLVVLRFLIAHEDELDEVHQDRFARAGDPGNKQVAMDIKRVVIAKPVDGVNAGEGNLTAHRVPLLRWKGCRWTQSVRPDGSIRQGRKTGSQSGSSARRGSSPRPCYPPR